MHKRTLMMKTIQAVLAIIMLFLLLSGMAPAQTKPKAAAPLSNNDVIEMVKAGFSNEIIIVKADDDDIRSTIVQRLNCSDTVDAVDSPKDADYFIEYTTLTRDVAPGRHGASMALKSQMRVVVLKPNRSRLIAWTETETFDVSGGFVLGAPNEINKQAFQ